MLQNQAYLYEAYKPQNSAQYCIYSGYFKYK